MSADGHTVCPKCHPDVIGWVPKPNWDGSPNRSTDNAAEELGYDRDMRENWEFAILDGDKLYSAYYADCWTCGFHFEINHEDPIPGLVKDE